MVTAQQNMGTVMYLLRHMHRGRLSSKAGTSQKNPSTPSFGELGPSCHRLNLPHILSILILFSLSVHRADPSSKRWSQCITTSHLGLLIIQSCLLSSVNTPAIQHSLLLPIMTTASAKNSLMSPPSKSASGSGRLPTMWRNAAEH